MTGTRSFDGKEGSLSTISAHEATAAMILRSRGHGADPLHLLPLCSVDLFDDLVLWELTSREPQSMLTCMSQRRLDAAEVLLPGLTDGSGAGLQLNATRDLGAGPRAP